jgi:hypothetical protein
MHPLLTKRIEIPWAQVLKGVAVILSLPSWALIAACIPYRGWIEHYFSLFVVICVVCWFCTSSSILLFIRSRGDCEAIRSSILRILWVASPILLVVLLGCLYLLYELGFVLTWPLHLGGMHDSM